MGKRVRGLLHVHSNFSRDGVCSVRDLAEFARTRGYRFVGLTDHAEDLLRGDMRRLEGECEAQSDARLIVMPGLEFRCDEGVHILGIGMTEDVRSRNAVTVAGRIRACGGLAILAHPGLNGHQCHAALAGVLNGVEVWNAGYDGRFVPPIESLRLLDDIRQRNPAVAGFGGADLHSFDRPAGVAVELRTEDRAKVDIRVILHHLRSGRFRVRGRYLVFDAYPSCGWPTRGWLWVLRKLYEVSRAARDVAVGERGSGGWRGRKNGTSAY